MKEQWTRRSQNDLEPRIAVCKTIIIFTSRPFRHTLSCLRPMPRLQISIHLASNTCYHHLVAHLANPPPLIFPLHLDLVTCPRHLAKGRRGSPRPRAAVLPGVSFSQERTLTDSPIWNQNSWMPDKYTKRKDKCNIMRINVWLRFQRLIGAESDLWRLEELHSALLREHHNLQDDFAKLHYNHMSLLVIP